MLFEKDFVATTVGFVAAGEVMVAGFNIMVVVGCVVSCTVVTGCRSEVVLFDFHFELILIMVLACSLAKTLN